MRVTDNMSNISFSVTCSEAEGIQKNELVAYDRLVQLDTHVAL